ncbi:MAG: D-alanine-D-alanine ligase, partial [Patescibacteria group bacterium]|nr:D-alanine-D-alanine ligase [Patescibacteria group bacterium]
MKRKITVGVLFGGRSAEHEVSLRSARTVVSAIDPEKYSVVLIGVDKVGRWFLGDSSQKLLQSSEIAYGETSSNVALTPTGKDKKLFNLATGTEVSGIDVLFPVLHGPYGEDGTVQGLAKLANVACVGAGVLGSAVGMDKDVMKRLLRDAGIAIGKFITITKTTRSHFSYDAVSKELGAVVFVKPANLGSSVGVAKASSQAEFDQAVETAFKFDRKVIVEEFINGREIECAVLGNDQVEASIPGEIVPHADFYSYDAKYAASSQSECKIPANLSDTEIKLVQDLAKKTFATLECRGMARVDFFYTQDKQLLVNEINTIPGFTSISMYPKMWEASGKPLNELVDELIELAIE